jgi:predicted DNA-binding transcriptional regulator AlpA
MPDELFVTYHELPNYGIPQYSRKHLLDLMKRNQFPAAVQLSANRVAWRVSSLREWIASRPTARAVADAAEMATGAGA